MQASKVVLVTGANRGLGHETCRQMAAGGYRVLLASRDLAAGRAAVAQLDGERVEAVQLEVTSAADIDALVHHIDTAYGRLDVLINNAGVMMDGAQGRSTQIRDADIEVIETTLATNTLAPIRLINALLPLLEKVTDARIVNVSSGLGQLSEMGANHPGYRLSKAALNAVTRMYAAELDPAKIKINSLCPGWVRTDMGGGNADLSIAEGVDTIVWLASSAEVKNSGGFYRNRQPIAW